MVRAGRSYRSTRGLWTLPYVNETRFVFRPPSTAVDRVLITTAILAQVVGACAIAWKNAGPNVASVWGVLWLIGFASGPTTFFLYGGLALPAAVSLSRVHRVHRRLVVERISSPAGESVLQTTVDGRRLAPTTRCKLLHARLLGYQCLLLVLGDHLFELWRSSPPGGGANVSREHDWVMDHLAGDEGSAREGAAEYGDGVLLPIIENLRRILFLKEDGESMVVGPEVPRNAWLWVLGLGATVGAGVYGVDVLLDHAADVVRDAPPRAALGATAGVLLILSEWIILRTWLRRTLVRRIDAFVGGILDG